MKTLRIPIIISAIAFFAACSGEGKKVLVMASGKLQVSGNTITLAPGTTHNETSLVPDGDSVIVVSPSGSNGFAVKENGLYILNLKKDTLVGSYQRTGTDNSQIVISQASLPSRIDSLQQLMAGTNVNDASKNYHIVPFAISKITGNTNAQVVGPYLKMPGSFDPSREHEVYKFYTNREMKDIVEKLKPMLSDSMP